MSEKGIFFERELNGEKEIFAGSKFKASGMCGKAQPVLTICADFQTNGRRIRAKRKSPAAKAQP